MNSLKYDPKGWSDSYITERNNLLYLLSNFDITVEQIGASAIPNGRSNRNVDILIVAKTVPDVSSITFKLQNSGYKCLNYLCDHEISTLVKQNKVKGYGITLRVVLNASRTHERYNAFKIYLSDSVKNIRHYNDFREALLKKYSKDWKSYYRHKRDFINSKIDESFKFE